jgi:hypothetical protein
MRRCPFIAAALAAAILPGAAWSASPPAQTRPAGQPAAYSTQMIYFGRSGRPVTVELAPTRAPMDRAALLAFGRTWAEAVAIRKQGLVPEADFKVPAVRVPTVFTIAHPDWPNRIMGELVAYPERDIEWDKSVVLRSCGAPRWFDQWAAATGLPVTRARLADLPDAASGGAGADGNSLLILGKAEAGSDLPDVERIAKDKGLNVLVLDANWFEETGKAASVAPSQMLGGLSEIAKQRWPEPLRFGARRRAWGGVVNRWAWMVDGNGLPLAEEIRPLTADERRLFPVPTDSAGLLDRPPRPDAVARLLASYVPWQEQLGRSESADAALLALLKAAGGAPPRDCQWSPTEVVYPERTALTPAARPVLSAVRTGGFWRRKDVPDAKPEYVSPINVIVDLRGTGPADADVLQGGAKGLDPDNRQPITRLILLGDDKVLDEWKWLGLDRAKKAIRRPGAIWLSDDELPPSKESQIRLMMRLTELGVPLAPPGKEEKRK